MFHLEDVLDLRPGEKVVRLVRQSPSVLILPLVCSALLISVPFFLLFPLISFGFMGLVAFIVSVVVGMAIAARSILMWDARAVVITTTRVVDVKQRGVLSRTVSEVALDGIHEARWQRKGVLSAVFSLGDIHFETIGTSPNIDMPNVAHPERITALLAEIRHPAAKKVDAEEVSHSEHDAPKREPEIESDEKFSEASESSATAAEVMPARSPRIQSIVDLLEDLSEEALDRIQEAAENEFRNAAAGQHAAPDKNVKDEA